jgi:hypothetical protein
MLFLTLLPTRHTGLNEKVNPYRKNEKAVIVFVCLNHEIIEK